MARRRVRSWLAVLRLRHIVSAGEYETLVQRERASVVARSVTYFALGFITGAAAMLTWIRILMR